MTLVMRDGAENASYAMPQPEVELPSTDGDADEEPQASSQTTGGALFVF